MAYKKHIFPLFLYAAVATTAGAGALSLATSYNIVSPATSPVAYTVAAGTIAGQMMVVINSHATNNAEVTFASPLNAAADLITLANGGEQLTAMWNGSSWVILGGETANMVA
jgi:hypothetical protein